LTTLAIIGGGLAGRKLLFTLAKQGASYSQVLLFESADFARPCSLSSTAIAAPRGVTAGKSPLGDMLLEGHHIFRQHCLEDRPEGVFFVPQYTGAISKLDTFQTRYAEGQWRSSCAGLNLKQSVYFAREEAILVDPPLYLDWLKRSARQTLPIECINQFVTAIVPGEKVTIKTLDQQEFQADQVVLATGAYSRLWQGIFAGGNFPVTKSVQGAYLEYGEIDWGAESFSFTLEGDNLIYRAHSKVLLIGSTSSESTLELAPLSELKAIHERLSSALLTTLPAFATGEVKVGLREKGPRREPYVVEQNNVFMLGGLYKNAYNLGLRTARLLASRLPRERV
jgi:glycine/D-amino acid oxidase-like deaminating enzyme